MNDRLEPLLTADDVASVLKISPKTVGRLLRDGELQGIKVGRQWRVRPDDLNNYLQAKTAGAPGRSSRREG